MARKRKLDLNKYKSTLLQKREQIKENIQRLEGESSGRDRLSRETAKQDFEGGGDAALEAQARNQSAAMIGNLRDMLASIDEALQSIEDGTYGICEICGKNIPKKRLEALPEATMCTECRTQIGPI